MCDLYVFCNERGGKRNQDEALFASADSEF